jgi:hypothetical protein
VRIEPADLATNGQFSGADNFHDATPIGGFHYLRDRDGVTDATLTDATTKAVCRAHEIGNGVSLS